MRLFTAIDVPPEVKARLRAFVDPLIPLAKLSWSPVANLHITTKFIGEWPEPRMPELITSLQSILPSGEIDIAIRGVGWFPDEQHPRVFWAGVTGNDVASDDRLTKLARSTEQAVTTLGVPKDERVYSPHLTLARVRERVPLDPLRKAIANTNTDFGTFHAAHFALYLSADGKYARLASFPLS